MAVGYTPESTESEDDILVLGEYDSDVITFSPCLPIYVSRHCRNNCGYCSFKRRDGLAVPYSTIKPAKVAREKGIREAYFISGERPDKFPEIRTNLDLWGFSSYIDYLYTITELSFLEGLIPVLDVGILTPLELKRMSEITSVFKTTIDGIDSHHFKKVYPESPGKNPEVRLKSLEWCGKLNLPTATGIMVGIGESKAFRTSIIKSIAKLHEEYGHIHEFTIQNFVPQKGTLFAEKSAPDQKTLLDTFEMARDAFPDDVIVNVPAHLVKDPKVFIKSGLRDFGRLPIGANQMIRPEQPFQSDTLKEIVESLGMRLQQRFPLQMSYIKDGRYSKKLGQIFDTYKYKIKKDSTERSRDLKTA